MNVSVKELESVVAVYQYRSFAEAAYQTAFSISAISKHVQHVESELGVRLFNRKTYKNNKLLTAEGERLMPYILQTTDTTRFLERLAQEMTSQTQGIRIGCIEIMSGSVIDRILADFTLKFPDITIQNNYMHLREIVHGIDTLALDCSFFLLNRDNPNSVIEVVRRMATDRLRIYMGQGQSEMQIAIRSDHPFAKQDSVSLRDLAGETFLLDLDAKQFPESVLSLTHLIGRSFDQIHKRYIDSKRQSMVLEIVAAGGGVFPKWDMLKTEYPGVKFLPVRDCPREVSFLFLFHEENNHKDFHEFRRFVETNYEMERLL